MKIPADTMCLLTATAPSVSLAPLASPNASAAVLFSPTTSARMPVSRTSLPRELDTSYARMNMQATATDAVLVATPIAVSFRARERLRNQRLALDIVWVLDDF